jgi:hypothetical protein
MESHFLRAVRTSAKIKVLKYNRIRMTFDRQIHDKVGCFYCDVIIHTADQLPLSGKLPRPVTL